MLAFYLPQLESRAARKTFRVFYRTYQQPMYKMAYRLLRETDLAEDAVQEAFVAILGQMEKVREMDDDECYAFAMVLARNKAVDILRRKKREHLVDRMEEQLITGPEAEGDDPLDGLPELYQSVLRLKALGFRPEEIAGMQGKKTETVYKQIARGKKLLREKLRKEGYDEY